MPPLSDPTEGVGELDQLIGAAKGVSDKMSAASSASPAADGEMPAEGVEDAGAPDPASIEAASGALVEAGLLPAPVSEVTPQFKSALKKLADEQYPGMYDLNDPNDLAKAIDHVASGSLAPVSDPFGGTGTVESPSSEWSF